MDLVFGALLSFATRRVISALAAGEALDRKDAAGAASAVLDALVGMQDQQASTLTRIESKIDRILVQDFNRSYQTGCFRLSEAASTEISASAQHAALEQARIAFLEAVAGTTEAAYRVRALHAAAVCSLLSGTPRMARRLLDDAWRASYRALVEAAVQWRKPRQDRGIANALGEALFSTAYFKQEAIHAELKAIGEALCPVTKDIQELRRMLGTPAHEAPLPLAPWTSRYGPDQPLCFAAESRQVSLPDGIVVQIHRAKLVADEGVDDAEFVFEADISPPTGRAASITVHAVQHNLLAVGPPWIPAYPDPAELHPESVRHSLTRAAYRYDAHVSRPQRIAATTRLTRYPDSRIPIPIYVGVRFDRSVLVVDALQ